MLVDGGADLTCLKRHGGWKSNSVAEGYIEESLSNKKEIAAKILKPTQTIDNTFNNPVLQPSTKSNIITENSEVNTESSSINFSNSVFHNCIFNVYKNKIKD